MLPFNELVLNKYRILRTESRRDGLLGRGTFGSVYLAHEELADRDVAIKELGLESADLESQQEEALRRFSRPERAEIVFSAHSVPMSVIAKGDPYQRHVEATVSLLMERGAWPNRHRLCYQSKVGASKWLQPSLHRTLHDLAAEKVREVCIVPVAFVSDHVETLGEIDHEAREEARRLVFMQFEMTAGLNDSPKFISALGQLVGEALGEEAELHASERQTEELMAGERDYSSLVET